MIDLKKEHTALVLPVTDTGITRKSWKRVCFFLNTYYVIPEQL